MFILGVYVIINGLRRIGVAQRIAHFLCEEPRLTITLDHAHVLTFEVERRHGGQFRRESMQRIARRLIGALRGFNA
jgi:hypothetical protein